MIRKLINIICLYSMNLLKPHQWQGLCQSNCQKRVYLIAQYCVEFVFI